MSRQVARTLIPGSMAVALCIVSPLVQSASSDQLNPMPSKVASPNTASNAAPEAVATVGEAPAPVVEKAYVGANQCFICHRPQTNTWSETKHAHAFTEAPKEYLNDPACLKCHVTGFGEPGGYVAGTEKDLLLVGCESCHGPGALHVDAAQRFVLAAPGEEEKLIQEIRDTIVKTPTDSVCVTCHMTEAHQSHPDYEGQPFEQVAPGRVMQCNPTYAVAQRSVMIAAMAHGSQYSIKTCGSCHYDHYNQWRSGHHAALSAMLPPKYSSDENCQNCHRPAQTDWRISNMSTDAHQNVIGAACESCHGPGLEHIGFTKRFIRSPLGPKQEQMARSLARQGAPTNGCLQCHLAVSHKEHVPFDKK